MWLAYLGINGTAANVQNVEKTVTNSITGTAVNVRFAERQGTRGMIWIYVLGDVKSAENHVKLVTLGMVVNALAVVRCAMNSMNGIYVLENVKYAGLQEKRKVIHLKNIPMAVHRARRFAQSAVGRAGYINGNR